MENTNEYPKNEKIKPADQEEVEFENASVDPGFATEGENPEEDEDLEGGSEDDNAPENDALNYKNDREHGAYNPKNI